MRKIKKYQYANGPITYNSSLAGLGLFSGSNFSLLNSNNLGSFNKLAPNINFSGAAGSIVGSGVSSLTGNITSSIFGDNRFGQTGKYLVDTAVNKYAVPALTKTISGAGTAAKSASSAGSAASAAANAGKLGTLSNVAGIAGIAATAASIAMGDKKTYSGLKGNTARNLDMAYDGLTAAANFIPGVGQIVSGGMAVAGALNKGIQKLGGGTDGMTTTDAILDSNLSMLFLPGVGWVNGFGGKKAHTLQNASWQEQAKMQLTADAYALDEKERLDASLRSGKKYGLFSRRARKKANALIDELSIDNQTRLDIYNNNILNEIRSQQQASINNLGYMNLVNGGLEPVSVGKHGMKIINRGRLKNIINKAASLSNKVLEINEIELFLKGGKSDKKTHWKKPENWNDEEIPYEEWIKDINPDFLSDNYDLKTAYKYYPKEQLERWKFAVNSEDPKFYMDYVDESGNYPYHLGSIVKIPGTDDFMFLKKGRENPELEGELNQYFSGKNGLLNTHNLSYEGDRYYYRKKTPQAFKQGGKSEYKKVKSDKAYYDKNSDTVYYTNDEDLIHEGFHARPDLILLELLKPYYENLNDEKILNFGGNLLFVKRFEGDPGHFYSPEELGARIVAAKFRTKGNNYTPEFFKYLRTNENLYGDNMRDLLYMYNDENLSKIFNLGNTQAFKQGGQMNVIPEGALHARKNNMELAKEGEITHKGIPVVDKDGNQLAEIECNEIIFNKSVTDFIEDNLKKFKSDDENDKEKDIIAIKVGKRLVDELFNNTDDRTKLIEKLQENEAANN